MHRPPRYRSGRAAIAPLVVAALGVTACSGGGDDAVATTDAPTSPPTTIATTTSTSTPPSTTSTTTTSTSTSTSTSTTTTTLPAIPRQPLTGAVLAEGEQPIDRPALVVKIDNAPGARRHHSGLAVADIVYEEIVEGSITRFAAVFHSQGSDVVGPIRSGRSQDVDMLSSLRNPLFAWSGGNPGVTRLIADSSLVDLNWQRGGRGYYRGSGSIPHNLYNSTDALWAQTPPDHPGAPSQQFEYLRPNQEFTGTPVTGADVTMRAIDVEWEWDAEQQRFLRSQEGSPHMDAQHGRIGATNVVVLGVQYRPSSIDARSPEAQTTGVGPVWVFSGGEVIYGTWHRETPDEPFTFRDEADNPVALTPGNTWMELAERYPSEDPTNPGVQVDIHLA